MTLLTIIVITGLLCNGLQIATEEGMILNFIRKFLDRVFIKKDLCNSKVLVSQFYYPILYCIRCMPSIYGTILCLFMLPITFDLLWQIPVVVISSVALSSIIHSNYI